MNKIICNVCSAKNFRSRTNKVFGNKLLTCINCGLIFAYPELSLEDLRDLYNKEYFKNDKSHLLGYRDYLDDKPNIIKTFQRRFKKIEKLHPNKGRVLDVGCAMGFFLNVADEEGWDVYGVEISEYAVNLARKKFGNKIFLGTLFESNLPENYFDVVTAWDYIEHVPNPKEELERIFKLLKVGGLLVLSTPDIGSWPAKITKDKWMGFKDIEHLYFFNKKTMQKLLIQNNFKIVKYGLTGKYISAELFVNRLSLYNNFLSTTINTLIPKEFLAKKSFYINPLDIMCVYAQKFKK